jgi:hypothetical protein
MWFRPLGLYGEDPVRGCVIKLALGRAACPSLSGIMMASSDQFWTLRRVFFAWNHIRPYNPDAIA